MKQLTCDICGSNDLVKQDGYFVCQYCQTKYSVEEAKNMMIEGTVDVKGTVQIDNSPLIEKYFLNARRALKKDDWEEVEKYYNLVEANLPTNIEALFFSSFGKAMLSLTDNEYYKRKQKFDVLTKSMSVISDYYEETNEDKQAVLTIISDYIKKMYSVEYVFDKTSSIGNVVGSRSWCINLFNNVKRTFLRELNEIVRKHNEQWLLNLIKQNQVSQSACYIATAVYGSYNCPEVWTLRRFRDYSLAESWYGRLFIIIYYSISPTLVRLFGKSLWFNKLWHSILDRMIINLRKKGFENTPYEDKNWR